MSASSSFRSNPIRSSAMMKPGFMLAGDITVGPESLVQDGTVRTSPADVHVLRPSTRPFKAVGVAGWRTRSGHQPSTGGKIMLSSVQVPAETSANLDGHA